jgi:hypothetical protein
LLLLVQVAGFIFDLLMPLDVFGVKISCLTGSGPSVIGRTLANPWWVFEGCAVGRNLMVNCLAGLSPSLNLLHPRFVVVPHFKLNPLKRLTRCRLTQGKNIYIHFKLIVF